MSLHNQIKSLKTSLESLRIQGRALLSCEDLTTEQVDAYKELVDTVLEGADMRLEDTTAITAAKAEEAARVQAVSMVPEAVISTESKKDDEEENEEEEEENDDDTNDADPDSETDSEQDLSEVESEQAEAGLADTELNDAETDGEEELTPRDVLEDTVDKVEHVVEKVEVFISATEGSGLTTDDVQAMADVRDNFESIAVLQAPSTMVNKQRSQRLMKAYTRLAKVTMRNLSKRTGFGES